MHIADAENAKAVMREEVEMEIADLGMVGGLTPKQHLNLLVRNGRKDSAQACFAVWRVEERRSDGDRR
jgi:hypothetical protein